MSRKTLQKTISTLSLISGIWTDATSIADHEIHDTHMQTCIGSMTRI